MLGLVQFAATKPIVLSAQSVVENRQGAAREIAAKPRLRLAGIVGLGLAGTAAVLWWRRRR